MAHVIIEPVVFRERVPCAQLAFGVLGVEAVVREEAVGRFEVSRSIEGSSIEGSSIEGSSVEGGSVEGGSVESGRIMSDRIMSGRVERIVDALADDALLGLDGSVNRLRWHRMPRTRAGKLPLGQHAFRKSPFRQSIEAYPLHGPRGPRGDGSFGRVFGLGHARMYSSVVVRR